MNNQLQKYVVIVLVRSNPFTYYNTADVEVRLQRRDVEQCLFPPTEECMQRWGVSYMHHTIDDVICAHVGRYTYYT